MRGACYGSPEVANLKGPTKRENIVISRHHRHRVGISEIAGAQLLDERTEHISISCVKNVAGKDEVVCPVLNRMIHHSDGMGKITLVAELPLVGLEMEIAEVRDAISGFARYWHNDY